MASLFEKLGGSAAIDATVDQFHERVLNDDRRSGRDRGFTRYQARSLK